jgi:hypothetical protein
MTILRGRSRFAGARGGLAGPMRHTIERLSTTGSNGTTSPMESGFTTKLFRRSFRMSRDLCMTILQGVGDYESYFRFKIAQPEKNASGCWATNSSGQI